MRTLEWKGVGCVNRYLKIEALDERNPGNGNCCYRIEPNTEDKYSLFDDSCSIGGGIALQFQNGSPEEVRINGITNEALMAIIIDRMQGFQAGPYACRENAIALTHMETALMWLEKRTIEREGRGVEGKYEK